MTHMQIPIPFHKIKMHKDQNGIVFSVPGKGVDQRYVSYKPAEALRMYRDWILENYHNIVFENLPQEATERVSFHEHFLTYQRLSERLSWLREVVLGYAWHEIYFSDAAQTKKQVLSEAIDDESFEPLYEADILAQEAWHWDLVEEGRSLEMVLQDMQQYGFSNLSRKEIEDDAGITTSGLYGLTYLMIE